MEMQPSLSSLVQAMPPTGRATQQGGWTDSRSTEQFVDEYTRQTDTSEGLLTLTYSPPQWGLWIVSAGHIITSQIIKHQLLHLLETYQPTFALPGLLPSTSLYFPFGFVPLHVRIFFSWIFLNMVSSIFFSIKLSWGLSAVLCQPRPWIRHLELWAEPFKSSFSPFVCRKGCSVTSRAELLLEDWKPDIHNEC